METMERLVGELAKLPGVGRRTAERLADHLIRIPEREAMALATAIRDAKRDIRSCSSCRDVVRARHGGNCRETPRR